MRAFARVSTRRPRRSAREDRFAVRAVCAAGGKADYEGLACTTRCIIAHLDRYGYRFIFRTSVRSAQTAHSYFSAAASVCGNLDVATAADGLYAAAPSNKMPHKCANIPQPILLYSTAKSSALGGGDGLPRCNAAG